LIRFWSLPAEPIETSSDEAGLCQTLRRELEQAVLRRLPPGEPVGAFLSGGLDSSLVVALAQRLHDRPIRTFSVALNSPLISRRNWLFSGSKFGPIVRQRRKQ
jgi:asparagine synthase (glutamine-hydrolysing)